MKRHKIEEALKELRTEISQKKLVDAVTTAVNLMYETGGYELTEVEIATALNYRRLELEGSQSADSKLVNVIGRYLHGGSGVNIDIVRFYLDKFIDDHQEECRKMVGDDL